MFSFFASGCHIQPPQHKHLPGQWKSLGEGHFSMCSIQFLYKQRFGDGLPLSHWVIWKPQDHSHSIQQTEPLRHTGAQLSSLHHFKPILLFCFKWPSVHLFYFSWRHAQMKWLRESHSRWNLVFFDQGKSTVLWPTSQLKMDWLPLPWASRSVYTCQQRSVRIITTQSVHTYYLCGLMMGSVLGRLLKNSYRLRIKNEM